MIAAMSSCNFPAAGAGLRSAGGGQQPALVAGKPAYGLRAPSHRIFSSTGYYSL